MQQERFRRLMLLAGDIVALYLALWLMLLIKYPSDELPWIWEIHRLPFTFIFILWISIFFIAGLYERESWNISTATSERLIRAMLIAIACAAVLFYLVQIFGITPKTNLLIQSVFSFFLIIGWRMLFSRFINAAAKSPVLFFGMSQEVVDFAKYLERHPHFGYRIAGLVKPEGEETQVCPFPVLALNGTLPEEIKRRNVSLVVASKEIHSSKELVRMLYDVLPSGVSFSDFPRFYETISGKIPVSLISEMWFLENITEREKRSFEIFKRLFDILIAILLGIPALILTPLISAGIKVGTPGLIFIKQTRVGKNGVPFQLYKFRSMVATAEANGPQWAQDNDTRITVLGGFLRKTRLDELPQLLNILKGEMSFIGPRPERPEFVEMLKKEIPFYDIRHLVRPGLSGWAQINFPYGSSVEDAMEKLQYDLYYIKNRSIALELSIALRTILIIVSRSGK